MRLKLTITLFVLNLLVFGLIVYLDRQADARLAEEQSSLLLQVDVNSINQIDIGGPALQQSRTLVKSSSGKNWFLTEPVNWPANLFAVTRILNQLQFLEEEISFSLSEIAEAGQSLADYGLDPAQVTLRLATEQGVEEFLMGASTEMGNRLYLMGPKRDRVHVASREVLETLIVPLNDLRNPQIFEIPVFEVRSLTMRITSPGDVTIRLAREGESWRFEAPLIAAADPAMVNTTIEDLTGIEALDFYNADDLDPNQTGLVSPPRRVSLEGNGRRQTLLLGNRIETPNGIEKVYAQRDNNPTIVAVPAAPFETLFEAQQKLRDTTIFSFDPETVNTVVITHADRQVSLQKLETGSWQVLQSGKDGLMSSDAADPELLFDLLSGLQRLEAREFVSDAPTQAALDETYGITAPQWTLKVESGSGEESLSIGQFFRSEEGQILLYAQKGSGNTVYGIDRDILRWLRVDALHYRDRDLRTLPRGARIRAIELVRLPGEEPVFDLTLDRETGSWTTLLDETGMPENQKEALLEFLTLARSFRVAEFIRDNFTENYLEEENKTIPWHYRLKLEIVLPGGENNQTNEEVYFLTERLSGSFQAAGSPALGLVFSLNQDMVKTLYPFVFTREKPDGYVRPEPVPKIGDPEAPVPGDSTGSPEASPGAGRETAGEAPENRETPGP
jgi:hypothetical protein